EERRPRRTRSRRRPGHAGQRAEGRRGIAGAPAGPRPVRFGTRSRTAHEKLPEGAAGRSRTGLAASGEEIIMAGAREVHVHLLPDLAPPGRLRGGLAVAVDVLRATTTMVHALAAGCTMIRPCAEVDEARALAGSMRAGRVLLGGERGGVKLPDFDVG